MARLDAAEGAPVGDWPIAGHWPPGPAACWGTLGGTSCDSADEPDDILSTSTFIDSALSTSSDEPASAKSTAPSTAHSFSEELPPADDGDADLPSTRTIADDGDTDPPSTAVDLSQANRASGLREVVRGVLAQVYSSAARHHALLRKRHDALCSFGSHVSWIELLEILGDSEDAWKASKVHRWLGVGEDVAVSLLSELREVRRLLAQEEQAAFPAVQPQQPTEPQPQPQQQEAPAVQRSGGWGFFSWLFGADARRGPRKVVHEVTAQYNLERLEELGVLGRGAYGSVSLVRDAGTGQVMALKSVSKGMLVEHGLQEAIMTEKAVMQSTSSPFLVKLAACFDRDQDLFFLLEAATGGDLFTVYRSRSFFGSERHARFYLACVLIAFEHLHGCGILYRDLKMENIVLDSRGYAKLCDFGTSTFATRAYTMCGTPEYMAPEVICGSGHGPGADWWALGVLAYELMMAKSPFMDPDPLQIFRSAREGIDKVAMPQGKQWPALVKSLCRPDPAKRLPMLPDGLQQVRRQELWADAGFDWGALEARAMAPPHEPVLEGVGDLSSFSCEDQEEPSRLTFYDGGARWFDSFEDTVGPLLRPPSATSVEAPPAPGTA